MEDTHTREAARCAIHSILEIGSYDAEGDFDIDAMTRDLFAETGGWNIRAWEVDEFWESAQHHIKRCVPTYRMCTEEHRLARGETLCTKA